MQLLPWYDRNKRHLPWRNTRNPYEIWISEIMLQQTKVITVIDFFMTFLRTFPDIQSLANAKENEILKIWQGLGYYSRALNIHHSAKLIVQNMNGIFPNDYEKIKTLKGIGDYTAAAIASFAFDLPHAAVDGNVKRVAARFWGIMDSVDKQSTTAQITRILNEQIVFFPPGEFNQAMIELGAMVCVPVNPKCDECPLRQGCFAFKNKLQAQIPVKDKKKAPKERYIDFVFIEYNNSTWIKRRDHSSIWKGLFEFPNVDSNALLSSDTPSDEIFTFLKDPTKSIVLSCFHDKHQLTHQTIFARFWHLSGKPSIIVTQNEEYLKVPLSNLHTYPVHRLMHKYLERQGIANSKKLSKYDK